MGDSAEKVEAVGNRNAVVEDMLDVRYLEAEEGTEIAPAAAQGQSLISEVDSDRWGL